MLLAIAPPAARGTKVLTRTMSCAAQLLFSLLAFSANVSASAAIFHGDRLQPAIHFSQAANTQLKASSASLEGKICNVAGDPLAGVRVRLEKDAFAAAVTARTDTDGHYSFSELSEGSYRLTLEQNAFRPLALSPVLLRAGEKKHLDAVLEKLADANNSAGAGDIGFSDSPNFTIAGVTDRSNMGVHGSDANVRTSDSLSKEAASLKSSSTEKATTATRTGDAHRALGDSKEAAGDLVGAVNEYEAAVKADPSEPNYFAWGAELLLHRAGQPAVQVFSNGAKAHPDSSRMLAGLGVAYYSNGQYNEAATRICRASELDPAAVAPYLFLGQMEKAAADPLPCSEKALARFAADQPANAQANFFYGLVLWKKARKTQDPAGFARAEQCFRKALEHDPNYAEVYLQLGMLYNARGEKDPALAAFQKAVSADPKSSQAHYQLSFAYRRAGDAAKADREMKTYGELRRSEDAALEKERRAFRQFVTILQEGKSARP